MSPKQYQEKREAEAVQAYAMALPTHYTERAAAKPFLAKPLSQIPYSAYAHLMALPVHNPERAKLRDKVKGDFETLQKKAHKYLTLATEYNARLKPSPLHFDGKGIYAKHVASACRRRPVPAQEFDFPDYTPGVTSFAIYAERFDSRNGLAPGVTFWFSTEKE